MDTHLYYGEEGTQSYSKHENKQEYSMFRGIAERVEHGEEDEAGAANCCPDRGKRAEHFLSSPHVWH